MLFVVALALAPIIQAAQKPDGGPTRPGPVGSSTVRPPITANSDAIPEAPVITVHSTDNVIRGKTGTFVLNMKPALMLGGLYANFSIGGTAVAGVDYVQPLSPAYVGQSGFGVIQVRTLADPRAVSFRQAYSVVITLEAGAGYALGLPRSATMWIKP